MALESRYDWNSAPPGARSWIKPWMVIALILSGGVHAGLYVWFQQVVVPREASPTRSAIESLKDLKVQQVINESAKPREPESTDEADKTAITEIKSKDIIKQVEEALPLRPGGDGVDLGWLDVKLLPEFKQVEKYFPYGVFGMASGKEGLSIKAYSQPLKN